MVFLLHLCCFSVVFLPLGFRAIHVTRFVLEIDSNADVRAAVWSSIEVFSAIPPFAANRKEASPTCYKTQFQSLQSTSTQRLVQRAGIKRKLREIKTASCIDV